MDIRYCTWFLVGLCALGCVGCGEKQEVPTYPVTGTVTRNGQPLEGAVVSFFPETGKSAVGTTDASGKYSLTTFTKDDGAVAGKYKVTILKYDRPLEETPATTEPSQVDVTAPDYDEYPSGYDEMAANQKAAAAPQNILPPKFAGPTTSGLDATVVEGEEGANVYNFEVDG